MSVSLFNDSFSFLFQNIAYFDDHKHNTGALTTRLATDASAVQGVRAFSFSRNFKLYFYNFPFTQNPY